MPTVPVYGGRKVDTAPLPGVRKQAALTEQAAGVGVEYAKAQRGEALSRLGETGGRLAAAAYTEIQRKAEERAQDVAQTVSDNELAKWQIKRLHDPDTGALNVRGRNAMGLPEQVMGEFDEVADGIEAGLTTPRQREIFRQIRNKRSLNMLQVLSEHTSREITRVEQEAVQTKVENTRAMVAANATHPDIVAREIDDTAAAIRAHGRNLGLDLDTIESQIAQMESGSFATVVQTLVDNGATPAAKAYFEEVSSRITDPEHRERLKKMLESQSELDEVFAQADRIIAEGGDEDAQLAKAAKLRGQIRQGVEQRIGQNQARAKQAQREQESDQLKLAYGRLFNGGRGGVPVESLPQSMQTALADHIPALKSFADSMLDGGGVQKSDLRAFYTMLDNAQRDPKTFAFHTTLEPLQSVLTQSDYRKLKDLQLDLRQGKPPKQLEDVSSRKEVFESTLRAYGIDTAREADKPGTEAANTLFEVRQMVDRRVEDIEADGKRVTATEYQQIVHTVLAEQYQAPASGFRRFFEALGLPLQSRRLAEVRYDDIPHSERLEIEASLRRRGRPVSPQTVRDAFVAIREEDAAREKVRR
jgi:hypothetical protein